MNKKAMFIIVISVITILGWYYIMLLDTNELMERVKTICLHENMITKSDLAQTPLKRYYYYDVDLENVTISADFKRLFVIHNFNSGYIWIRYSICAKEKSGNEVVYGSWNVPSLWKIQKKDGEWNVIEIEESP